MVLKMKITKLFIRESKLKSCDRATFYLNLKKTFIYACVCVLYFATSLNNTLANRNTVTLLYCFHVNREHWESFYLQNVRFFKVACLGCVTYMLHYNAVHVLMAML